jgi:hypothetical protein
MTGSSTSRASGHDTHGGSASLPAHGGPYADHYSADREVATNARLPQRGQWNPAREVGDG